MNRLNYFNPYINKTNNHEDRLTRAFLVLLRYSPSSFSFFYEAIKQRSKFREELPNLYSLINKNIEIQTQVSSAKFETVKLLSILITNDYYTDDILIKPSCRTATYDGVITLGDNLTIIIETKPDRNNVWQDQLCPSKENLSDDIEIISMPVVIMWSSIITWLNEFAFSNQHNYSERLIVEDFLSFVNENYSYLNPFDRFDLCKGNHSLILKRISTILKFIVKDEDKVKYHQGWGFYIELPYNSIRKIGLIFHPKENCLKLSLYFADTQGQARGLYPVNIDINEFEKEGWIIHPNFHFGFMTSNIIWFSSNDIRKYIDYWNQNTEKLRQIPNHIELKKFVRELVIEDVINNDDEGLKNKIYNSKMEKINVCPGLAFIYEIPLKRAEELDQKGELSDLIKNKIDFCLKNVISRNSVELLNG
ncbi:hypothetical protein [Lutibacter citreus]|uniref:hypothetical protein n=1 Tax=Lutibacter citreus TaxID=2138210 RepID=UPI000DBE50D7|nr:hypothetical protein [Lutibacter citreus]